MKEVELTNVFIVVSMLKQVYGKKVHVNPALKVNHK